MPRPARDDAAMEELALEQFISWRDMVDPPESKDGSAIQFTATERSMKVRQPAPGAITVRYADGTSEIRPMTEAEREAWEATLDPELDEVREDG